MMKLFKLSKANLVLPNQIYLEHLAEQATYGEIQT